MEYLLYVLLGIGLAAACGFRVFVPFLAVSIAALAGQLQLAPDFAWLGSWPALIVFGVATILEIVAYFVPWLDHVLDVAATPAAIIAGIIVTASVITGMSPVLRRRWRQSPAAVSRPRYSLPPSPCAGRQPTRPRDSLTRSPPVSRPAARSGCRS